MNWWASVAPRRSSDRAATISAAGIERDISPHTLRHTAITRYLRATGNLELTRKFARHANIETTARIYAHLVQEDVDNGVRLLPGNGEYEARDETAELSQRIADLEEQLAALRKAVAATGGRQLTRGRRRGDAGTR